MVFTMIYLKQTVFLGYIVLQLFCVCSLCYTVMLFRTWNMFCTFKLVVTEVCVQSLVRLFFVFP